MYFELLIEVTIALTYSNKLGGGQKSWLKVNFPKNLDLMTVYYLRVNAVGSVHFKSSIKIISYWGHFIEIKHL